MNPNSNILQELQELNSSLSASAQTPYAVPNEYFDGLLEQVMRRIKALEAANATDELGYLSPVLSRVSKQMPYTVPAGYFESVEGRIAAIGNTFTEEETSPLLSNLDKVNPYTVPAGYFETVESRIAAIINTELSAKEELDAISPLLSSLKKTNPYSVPAGYFEAASAPVKEEKPVAKVISLGSRKWFRLAAVAVVTGVIFMAGVLLLSDKKTNAEIADISDKELIEILNVSPSGTEVSSTSGDAKELLKDISDSELNDFLQETSELSTEDEKPILN